MTLWAVVSHKGPERFFLSSREAYEFLAQWHDEARVTVDMRAPYSLTVEEYRARKA